MSECQHKTAEVYGTMRWCQECGAIRDGRDGQDAVWRGPFGAKAHGPLPFTSTHRAVASCRGLLRDARRDLKEAPINSVAFGHAEGRIEAAHFILDELGEKP